MGKSLATKVIVITVRILLDENRNVFISTLVIFNTFRIILICICIIFSVRNIL